MQNAMSLQFMSMFLQKDLTSKLCAALEKVLRLKKENDKLQLERAQHATAVQALQVNSYLLLT